MQEENSKTLRHKSLGYGLDCMVEQVDYAMSFGGVRKMRLRRREGNSNTLPALESRNEQAAVALCCVTSELHSLSGPWCIMFLCGSLIIISFIISGIDY